MSCGRCPKNSEYCMACYYPPTHGPVPATMGAWARRSELEAARAELSRMTARHETACAENIRLRAEIAQWKEAAEMAERTVKAHSDAVAQQAAEIAALKLRCEALSYPSPLHACKCRFIGKGMYELADDCPTEKAIRESDELNRQLSVAEASRDSYAEEKARLESYHLAHTARLTAERDEAVEAHGKTIDRAMKTAAERDAAIAALREITGPAETSSTHVEWNRCVATAKKALAKLAGEKGGV